MAWDKGFNFRSTAIYVTDGANETYDIGTQGQQNRNSVTFGWVDSGGNYNVNQTGQTRDRNAGIDRRLAGCVFIGTASWFKVDLPLAGAYTIRVAMGDPSNSTSTCSMTVVDGIGGATLATLTDASIASGSAIDATSTEYTDANWPANNSTITVTFPTAAAYFLGGSGTCPLQHIFLSQVTVASNWGRMLGGELNRLVRRI